MGSSSLLTHPGLTTYAQLLRQWNPKINLVSPTTLPSLESRHFTDSAQLLDDLPSQTSHIADVGTGAGFPGLVMAILAPQHQYSLIESDSRKAAFLQTVIQTLSLTHVKIYNQRVEEVVLNPLADVITARAFAPLVRLLPQTRHLLTPNGCWLLLKGEAVNEELRGCETLFPMTITKRASMLQGIENDAGWVVKILPEAE